MESGNRMDGTEMPKAGEPAYVYGVAAKARVFSDEELSHGIPVEESRRRLTEMIYSHYHQS